MRVTIPISAGCRTTIGYLPEILSTSTSSHDQDRRNKHKSLNKHHDRCGPAKAVCILVPCTSLACFASLHLSRMRWWHPGLPARRVFSFQTQTEHQLPLGCWAQRMWLKEVSSTREFPDALLSRRKNAESSEYILPCRQFTARTKGSNNSSLVMHKWQMVHPAVALFRMHKRTSRNKTLNTRY